MKLTYLMFASLLAGCSNTVQPIPDGGADAVSDVAADSNAALDTAAADTIVVDAPRSDTGPFMCGTETCTPAQFCLARAGGPGISRSCQDIPAACGTGGVTCACLGTICPIDVHNSCTASDRNADCSCLDCP